MFTQKKYHHLINRQFKEWKDTPQTQVYSLDVLIKQDDGFISKMQWKSSTPDKGVQCIEHYQQCEPCQQLMRERQVYAIFLFYGNRFVYGYDLHSKALIRHNKDYKAFLRSLM